MNSCPAPLLESESSSPYKASSRHCCMVASVLSGLFLLVLATSARSLHWSNQVYITKPSIDDMVADVFDKYPIWPHIYDGCVTKKYRATEYTNCTLHGRIVLIYSPPRDNLESSRPAVLVLHGNGTGVVHMRDMTQFENVSRDSKTNFLVVYPGLMNISVNPDWIWQEGNPQEIEFFQELSSLLRNEFGAGELYAAGHSSGGIMSLYLQNVMPGVFTGVAAVEAGLEEQILQYWNSSSYGRPTIVFFNHNDNTLKEHGGEHLFNHTLSLLRRFDRSHTKPSSAPMFSHISCSASLLFWPGFGQQPPLAVVSWKSLIPSHCWPCAKTKIWDCKDELEGCPLDAASIVWEFWQSQQVHEWKNST